ncbi:MAG: WxcM-like domain-containing protein [Cytophagaceae bacterium]|nr:WxcM-like domain-containing protein [Cytophagaceae bacterium]MBP6093239.1 WxcM-like domain-containing protein [Cytophagaceae bacterium]
MMKNSSLADCRILDVEKVLNRSGNISFLNNDGHLPFQIQRVFYLYDIPGGESRGAHAHKKCHQFLVAASGSFEVLVNDGVDQKIFQLNRSNVGLYIPPGIWASEINFSSGSVCLVLASDLYDASDYIRDYNELLNYKNG